MQSLRTLSRIAVLIVLVATLGWAQDARQAIEAAYQASHAAAARRDVDGSLAHLSDDSIAVDPQGREYTRAQRREGLRNLFTPAQSVHIQSEITSFQLSGSRAEVQLRERLEARVPNRGTGKLSTLVIEDSARDVWVLGDQGWKLTRSTCLTQNFLLDGQPFQP